MTISLLAEHGNQVLAALRKEADSRGFYGRLTAAELELMSLTGTGNGLDMVMMPGKLRERVPTSNFFRRAGYQRNPVARRAKVVSGLIDEIQTHIARARDNPGARELAAAFQRIYCRLPATVGEGSPTGAAMPNDVHRTVRRVYDEINSALWALLCVVTLYVAVFVLPHVREFWARAEQQLAQEIAVENSLYCGKWSMGPGTPTFESCALDLQKIRAAAERRLAESEF